MDHKKIAGIAAKALALAVLVNVGSAAAFAEGTTGPETHDISRGNLVLTDHGPNTPCYGHAVKGMTGSYTIQVQSGSHNVTFEGVSIQSKGAPVRINSGATLNLTLKSGTSNYLTGGVGAQGGPSGINPYHPGIDVPKGAALKITSGGSGKLKATGGTSSPGIGGGSFGNLDRCGSVVINGGDITAIGGEYAAGIGGGFTTGNGSTIITGGTVTATGGKWGAGIGGGGGTIGILPGDVGSVLITGGTVKATGGAGLDGSPNAVAPGIGGGYGSIGVRKGGSVEVTGGSVQATIDY